MITGLKKKLNDKSTLNNKTIIVDSNNNIPYGEIENTENITFVIVSTDESTITKIITSINEFHLKNKNLNITVVLSSSYDKLHTISHGIF